jgi:hypothetical protein
MTMKSSSSNIKANYDTSHNALHIVPIQPKPALLEADMGRVRGVAGGKISTSQETLDDAIGVRQNRSYARERREGSMSYLT